MFSFAAAAVSSSFHGNGVLCAVQSRSRTQTAVAPRRLSGSRRSSMGTEMKGRIKSEDAAVTLCPYFKVQDGKMDEFKKYADEFYKLIEQEEKLLHYSFSYGSDGRAHCREGYADVDGLLTHLSNVQEALGHALSISTLERLEVHLPASQVAELEASPLLQGLEKTIYILDGKGVRYS